jgi:outer membrane protein assembly factor BamA
VGVGEVVGHVRFDGNGGFLEGTSDLQVRKAMEVQPSSWVERLLHPKKVEGLDRAAMMRDAWRVEVWYAHHGYFDARFLAWDVQTRRPRRGTRPALVDLVGTVEQGEPTTIRNVTFEGMDAAGAPILAQLRSSAEVSPGDRFNLDDIKTTEQILLARLRDHSFARVAIQTKIDVFPEDRAADVRYVAVLGPPCRFGEVKVAGAHAVPSKLVAEQVVIHPGEPYRASTLTTVRQKLFSLGTFSSVTVLPRDNPEDPATVPIDVKVVETRFRQLKAGLGLAVESGKQDVHLSGAFRHTNLFGRMHRLDLGVQAGLASNTSFSQLVSGGSLVVVPTILATGTYLVPHFFGPHWSMSQVLSYDQGLESTFRYVSPSYSPGVTWSRDEHLSLTTDWRLRYFHYLDLGVDLTQVQGSRLGLDLTDPYWLSVAEEKLVWDGRDNPLATRRGSYALGTVGMAGGPFGGALGAPFFGQFNYVKLSADGRLYRSLVKLVRSADGWVFATRIAGGVAMPYGVASRAKVPFAERFYVGGGTTVRGWGTDRLGPYVCDKGGSVFVSMRNDQTCDNRVPIGGLLAGWGSVELRVPFRWGLGAAFFSDAGFAWDNLADAATIGVLPTAGGGLRYASPVGPLRLDVGFRLDHNPLFDKEPRWNLHFSLAEAF